MIGSLLTASKKLGFLNKKMIISPSQQDEKSPIIDPRGPYVLLNKYRNEARVLSGAYKLSEIYYRTLHQAFTYPVVVFSAAATVASGLHVDQYIIMGISFASLIFSGFSTVVAPKDKENRCNRFSTEFGEIDTNITQFVQENNKEIADIKNYSKVIHELLNSWKAMAPPLNPSHLARSNLDNIEKIRTIKDAVV